MYLAKTILAMTAITIGGFAYAETVTVATDNTSLMLDATPGEELRILYYGDLLSEADMMAAKESGSVINKNAYPVYGRYPQGESAMSVVHPDGNMTLDLVVDKVSQEGNLTVITLRDKVYPFTVNVNYRSFPEENIIETWVEASHKEKAPVRLTRFDSAYLPVRYGDVWLTNFYGSWANETRIDEAPLKHGMKTIKNKDGVRNSQTSHGEVMLSLDGKPQENEGRVIGAAIVYSGNYELRIDTDDSNYHHFFAGINPDNSEYYLEKDEVFVTPPVAFSYSGEGLGGVSRNFHRWGRNHRIAHGNEPRKILLNSWEGVYLDIKEPEMHQMMQDIADMGGELFVMDDGWFGTEKYNRNVDNAALGDWIVDTRKLPNGIKGLVDTAESKGIKFGIWIEPEMVNTTSHLYDKHPEYVIHTTNRDLIQGRGGTQAVLDLSNPKVQDIVFEIVDTLLTKYPQIDYIKWDANAPVMEHGSQYLPKDRQSHLNIEYHKGFAKVMDRIREKYPDVTIQACASGGGRASYGVLPWFDEFWTSDNTDALQRVFMQWGTSYFFPAVAMASHISNSPNHQTMRIVPLKYRTDVAMSGRLGMEIQPRNMTQEERDQCKKAIEDYKKVRGTVQQGDLYRLLSPYEKKGAASLMYVSPEKDDAVFFWYKTETFCNQQLPRIPMAGLDPDKTYTVTELNRIDNTPLPYEGKSFSGRYLMANGLEMPLGHNVNYNKRNDFASRVLHLKAK